MLALAAAAEAQPAPAWTILPIAGTDVPVDIAAGVEVEAPVRARLTSTLGILPGPYVDLINTALVGFGAYDQDVANLIASSLKSSLVWRTELGYRPLAAHGLYAMIGYELVTLGGSAAASEVVTAATGKQLPPSDQGGKRSFDVHSTLHLYDFELGWEWRIRAHWHVRAGVGAMFSFASSTTITPDYTPTDPRATKAFTDAGAKYLDSIYKQDVCHWDPSALCPVVTAMGGYEW